MSETIFLRYESLSDSATQGRPVKANFIPLENCFWFLFCFGCCCFVVVGGFLFVCLFCFCFRGCGLHCFVVVCFVVVNHLWREHSTTT